MILSTVLFQQANVPFITGLLLWGACFIHSVLSLYLQRSLILPEIPLKENTPGGIQIMGVIALLFSCLILITGMVLVNLPESVVKEIRDLMVNKDEQQVITRDHLRVAGLFLLLPGIVISLNVILSLRFLRQWRQQQATSHNDKDQEEE